VGDLLDRAQAIEEAERNAAIDAQAARGPLPAAGWDRTSAKWCEGANCGESIPDERRRAYPGVRLCVECQMRKEKQERRSR
jgi:phage/conjugal plasmid C-4 type zinc finger TraR family protein